MVTLREGQISGITVLDEDESGTVDVSSADLENVGGIIHVPAASAPGNNSFWVQTGSPTLPRFTNSAGATITLGTGGGGSDVGSLSEVLDLGNSTDGYDII